jgi:hypothetical protein
MTQTKQRINIMIDNDLLARMDALSGEIGKSRSAVMCDLMEKGLQQALVTKRFAGNKHVLRAIGWLFGWTGAEEVDAKQALCPDEEKVNVAREIILKQLRDLSLFSAREDIDAELGIEVDENKTEE